MSNGYGPTDEEAARARIAGLTLRQTQVLELIEKRRTLKQIAYELSISESAVNQHVRAIKAALKVNSLAQLADEYREISRISASGTYRESAPTNSALSKHRIDGNHSQSSDAVQMASFHEAFDYRVDLPWKPLSEPTIVPEMLNGANAGLARGAYIIAIACGLFALILVGLGVAQGLTSMLRRPTTVSVHHLGVRCASNSGQETRHDTHSIGRHGPYCPTAQELGAKG